MKTNERRGPGNRPIISIQDGIVPFERDDGRTPAMKATIIVVNHSGTIHNPVVRIGEFSEGRKTPTSRYRSAVSDRQTIL